MRAKCVACTVTYCCSKAFETDEIDDLGHDLVMEMIVTGWQWLTSFARFFIHSPVCKTPVASLASIKYTSWLDVDTWIVQYDSLPLLVPPSYEMVKLCSLQRRASCAFWTTVCSARVSDDSNSSQLGSTNLGSAFCNTFWNSHCNA